MSNVEPQEMEPMGDSKKDGKTHRIETNWKMSGLPYDPRKALIDVGLPSSIYSSIIVVPASHGQELFTMIIPQYICWAVCITLQISFLAYLGQIVNGVVADNSMCPDIVLKPSNSTTGNEVLDTTYSSFFTVYYLRIICLLVFVAAGLLDLFETISIHLWVSQIPTFNKEIEQPIIDKLFKESGNEEAGNKKKGKIMGRTDLPHQDYIHIDENEYGEDDKMSKIAVGMTMPYRIFQCYICCIIPKTAIGFAMLYYGSGHVLGSPDSETMILNTLAAMFVFEVDDIIYNLMISPLHQFWIEKTFSFTKSIDGVSRVELYSFWIVLPLYILAVFLLYEGWCIW